MVDTTVVQAFFYQVFGIPPQNFWPAFGGGIIAAAVVFFFMNIILSKITENKADKEGLVNGVSLIFAIATMIYVWYSGIWGLMIGFMTFAILFGLFIFFIILWTIFRKHRAEHISSKMAIHKARSQEIQAKIEARKGEIEKVIETEESLNQRKEQLVKSLYANLNSVLNEDNLSKMSEHLGLADSILISLFKIVEYEYKTTKWIKDRKLAKFLRREMDVLNSMKEELNVARESLARGDRNKVIAAVKKALHLAKNELKFDRKEDKIMKKDELKKESEEVKQLKNILKEIEEYKKNPSVSRWEKKISPLIEKWDKEHPDKKIRFKGGMIAPDIVKRVKELIKEF